MKKFRKIRQAASLGERYSSREGHPKDSGTFSDGAIMGSESAAHQRTIPSNDEQRAWSILRRGAGEWVGEESMPPAPWAPEGMASTGRISAHPILGGRGLASEYVQEVDGQIQMMAHTVFRWDESRNLFIMHFVTAAGGEATVLEGRRDGDRVIFEGTGPMGPTRQTFHYGADLMEVSSEAPSPGSGEWAVVFRGRYRAVASGPDVG